MPYRSRLGKNQNWIKSPHFINCVFFFIVEQKGPTARTGRYSPVALFITVLHRAAQEGSISFVSVNETLNCDHYNESFFRHFVEYFWSRALLS